MKHLYIFIVIVFFNSLTLNSQKRQPLFYIGGFFNYNFTEHLADFNLLPQGSDTLPASNFTKGNGFSYGGLFEVKLIEDINFSIYVGFTKHYAIFSNEKNLGLMDIKNKVPPYNNRKDTVIVNHRLQSDIFSVFAEPEINFELFGGINLIAASRVGYLITARYDLDEVIKSPADVLFLNDKDYNYRKNDIEIPEKNNLQLNLGIGIKYNFNLGANTYLVPQAKYYFQATTISKNTWKINSLEAGLALKLPIYGQKLVIKDTVIHRDTSVISIVGLSEQSIYLTERRTKLEPLETDHYKKFTTIITESYVKEIPKPVFISSSLESIGVHNDGTREKNPTIVIEEIEFIRETVPLLPYLFFKEGSASIAETDAHLLNPYEKNEFSDDSLKPKTLVVYTELINIVGFRLSKKFPNATLTIVGCNNNLGVEKDNIHLSNARALAVKDYLINTWSIEPDRITIKCQNLPSHPASSKSEDGQRENQRIEFYTDTDEVLAPVMIKSFTRRTKIPVVEIYPTVKADIGTDKWSIDVKQSDKLLRSFSGKGEPPHILKWQILDEPIPQYDVPVITTLYANDTLNQATQSQTECKILHKRIKLTGDDISGGTLVEKFYIIAHFDAPDLLANQPQFINHIKSRIKLHSKVNISGFCDRTGNKAYNKRLAQKRVNDVQNVLQVKESNLEKNAIGSDELLYDNDLPQGRCYSRTIKVTVSTFIK
jgi:outer membrane protein OmpA-like peptidoglycan-associated protein